MEKSNVVDNDSGKSVASKYGSHQVLSAEQDAMLTSAHIVQSQDELRHVPHTRG